MALPPRRSSYRHGDLPRALVTAGVELARAGGPDAVVLREATRRAGVAPNAAYRHFADRRALLHAVREVALSHLALAMEAEQVRVPAGPGGRVRAEALLRATGAGYLRYAQDEPGLFRTAFSGPHDMVGAEGEGAVGARGLTPYQLVGEALDGLVAAGVLAADRRPDAEVVAWSAVHGLASLVIDGPLRSLERQHVDQVGDRLLEVVMVGLRSTPG